MKSDQIAALLGRLDGCRVGVLGDYCVDAYWSLREGERELSVETWKPTRAVIRQTYSLGGAANIVANLAALEVGAIRAFAVVGDDIFGREMVNQLEGLAVDCGGVVVQTEGWDTSVYAKPYLGDEEQERLDFGRFNTIAPETEARLIEALERAVPELDALVVNQQLPQGINSESVTDCLLRLAASTPSCRFVVDSRDFPTRYRNMIVKVNAREAAQCCGEERGVSHAIPVEDVERHAARIQERTGRPVVVSRGPRGMLALDGERTTFVHGVQILKKTDPVGAGDTTSSALGGCLAAGASVAEAAEVANLAAAVTVRKLKQTGTASRDEILALAADVDYVFNPELAEDVRRARFLGQTRVEIVNDAIERGRFAHAVFDHDGTVSCLREGWEAVMEPVMIKAIMGDSHASATEDVYQKVVAHVRAYIDQSTGIQTILQMQGLAEMVRDFGLVPPEDILDAQGYKRIYNDALMALIRRRRERVAAGELDVSDYTIKGAVRFLEALRERGLRLYLASGTDEEDVRAEAELLGYADLFDGGIFGAVGDIGKYSKKMVIDRIIRDNGLSGPQLVTFGDGPVEIRETKKRDGVAVGVASDEVRRFDLNREKRARLIRAGADLIAPDYSQQDALLKYLFDE